MISLDYGEGSKMVAYSARGVMEIPRPPKGLNPAGKFAAQLESLLAIDDVVCESPTVGASGAEPLLVKKVVDNAPHILYKVSARQVKNKAKDEGLAASDITDEMAARFIWELAVRPNAELAVWTYEKDFIDPVHTSVRPYDKRNYKDPQVDIFMSRLPNFDDLPEDLQTLFTNGLKKADYSRSRALPFAMAFDEFRGSKPSRNGYEKFTGLYCHGRPSFYRRATIDLNQRVAKQMFVKAGAVGSGQNGKPVNSDIPPALRKRAWKHTRKMIRKLYHLSVSRDKGTTPPAKGHERPLSRD